MSLSCRLLGHKWDMFAGYYEERVHQKAYCQRWGRGRG
ncbi:DUF1660 family phage protein [Arthrobacter sp. V1I9]